MIKNIRFALVSLLLLGSAQFASAAVLTIDDTDIDDITYTWSGFDVFTLGGVDYFSDGSSTFADTSIETDFDFFASFFVADIIDAGFEFSLGSEVGAPGDVTSGFFFDLFALGPPGLAGVGGSAQAYIASAYGPGFTTFEQGDTVTAFGSGFELTFVSESGEIAGVPAPASLYLLGLALIGLGLRRKAHI